MKDSPLKLDIHIYPGKEDDTSIPVETLVQVLENAQRAFEVIGLSIEGKTINKRAKASAAISKKYQLIAHLPKEGSYAVPVTAGDLTSELFDKDDIKIAWNKLTTTLSSISKKDVALIEKTLPDISVRRRVFESIKAMAPKAGSSWRVKFFTDEAATELAELADTTPQYISELIKHEERLSSFETVTGELRSIDFKTKSLRIIYPVTRKELECRYEDVSVEDFLYANRRDYIHVTGNVILDSEGIPKEILDVSEIVDLDDSDFEIELVEVGDFRLKAISKIIIPVLISEDYQILQIEYPELNISASGSTRSELLEDFSEQLKFVWIEFGQASNEVLTSDAIKLKNSITQLFTEIPHAN